MRRAVAHHVAWFLDEHIHGVPCSFHYPMTFGPVDRESIWNCTSGHLIRDVGCQDVFPEFVNFASYTLKQFAEWPIARMWLADSITIRYYTVIMILAKHHFYTWKYPVTPQISAGVVLAHLGSDVTFWGVADGQTMWSNWKQCFLSSTAPLPCRQFGELTYIQYLDRLVDLAIQTLNNGGCSVAARCDP
eukprot:TRINITY_DN3354_c0_g1_i1.p2 TRINITY_DN3354_c0_g1~~TRINITY_DN3354_c0_g1_i1.p2  ORF type:complete len:189 (+),score=20.30 TRINITY_DN3354_c0_g1_i1:463-1029(+)